MRFWLFLLLTSLLLPCGARDIYRSVSEDGVVSYSDSYLPGAERISVKDSGAMADANKTAGKAVNNTELPVDQDNRYQTFRVEQPENDQTIHSNEGTLLVGLSVLPALATGHLIHVYLDGAKLDADMTTTQFSLTGLNRGTHSIQAKIVDAEGRPQIATKSINFHLKKASIQNP